MKDNVNVPITIVPSKKRLITHIPKSITLDDLLEMNYTLVQANKILKTKEQGRTSVEITTR